MAKDLAYNLGLYARQKAILALAAELHGESSPADLELRLENALGTEGCARTPFAPPDGPTPFVKVPICTAVQLRVDRSTKGPPLYVGALYLSNDGSIVVFPRNRTVRLDKQESLVEPLGWVSPPVDTPDWLLVFGTTGPIVWSRLEAPALRMPSTRGYDELEDFLFQHLGGTRGIASATTPGASMTASLIQLEVAADPEKWTLEERQDPRVCRSSAGCRAGSKKKRR